jgi:hypothetical protein
LRAADGLNGDGLLNKDGQDEQDVHGTPILLILRVSVG